MGCCLRWQKGEGSEAIWPRLAVTGPGPTGRRFIPKLVSPETEPESQMKRHQEDHAQTTSLKHSQKRSDCKRSLEPTWTKTNGGVVQNQGCGQQGGTAGPFSGRPRAVMKARGKHPLGSVCTFWCCSLFVMKWPLAPRQGLRSHCFGQFFHLKNVCPEIIVGSGSAWFWPICSLIQKSLLVNFELRRSCLVGSTRFVTGHSEGRNTQNASPRGNVLFNVIDRIDNNKLEFHYDVFQNNWRSTGAFMLVS